MAQAKLFGSDLLDVSQSQKRISSQSSRYFVCDNLVQSLPGTTRFISGLEFEKDTGLTRSFSADNVEQSNHARDLRRHAASVLQYMHTKNISEVHATHFKSSDSELNRPTPPEYSSPKTRHKTENRPIANQQFRENKIHENTLKGMDSESTDTYVSVTQSATKSEYCSSKTINTEKEPNIERQTLQQITTKHQGMNQNNQDLDEGLKSENKHTQKVRKCREKTVSGPSQLTATNVNLKNIQEGTLTMEKSDYETLATNSTHESGVSLTNYTIYADNSSISVESKDTYFKGDSQRRSHGSASEQLKFIMGETLLLMERHKNENVFVRSRAFHAARRNLELNNLVTITGNPGEGKTSLGIELLVFFSQGEPSFKRTPAKVHNCWDLRVITNQRKDLVIFIDDLFASKSFEKQGKEDWQNTFEIMAAIIKESDVMIILAMNNQILNRYRKDLEKYDIFEKKMIVDLNHEATSLTIDEKAKLLVNHLNEPSNGRLLPSLKIDTDSIAKIEDTFAYPMCCHLFSRHEEYFREGEDFFRYPLISLCRELESMKNNASSKMQFVLLVSILLFDGVDEFIFKFRAKSSEMRALRVFASSIKCECPSAHDLNVLQELLNIFVIYKRKYLFKNNIIREAVCLIYGSCCPKDQSEQALDMLSMDVLCRFVKVTNCTVSCVCWHIDEGLYSKLGTRLLNGLSFETIEIVANHSAWESSDFCDAAFDSDIKRKDLYQLLAPVPHGSRCSSLLYKIIERLSENRAFLKFSKLLLNSIKHAIDRNRFSRRLCRYFQEVIYDCLWLALECEDQDIVLLSLCHGAKVDDEIIQRSKRIQNRNIVELIGHYS